MESFFAALGIDASDNTVARGSVELSELGVRTGGVLLVHSAFRAARASAGSIENILGSFMRTLGQEGTLLLPSLSYDHVTRKQPLFDVERTPSNIGAIAEFFRVLPVTRRSVHPTHSVSGYGAEADEMLSKHQHDTTPVGPHSPFRAVRDRGGQLLMFGCGLRPNTSMHGVEEFASAPYVLGEQITYTIRNGENESDTIHRRHGFGDLIQRYDRVANVLKAPALRRGSVFGTECWLIEVAELWERCAGRIRSDPYYFIESP
jgi:aminoglycoside 3-N-acetyltransferase